MSNILSQPGLFFPWEGKRPHKESRDSRPADAFSENFRTRRNLNPLVISGRDGLRNLGPQTQRRDLILPS